MKEDTYLLLKDAGYPNIDKRDIEDAAKWLEEKIGLVADSEKLFNGKYRPMIYDASDNKIILTPDLAFEDSEEAFECAIANACDFYLAL